MIVFANLLNGKEKSQTCTDHISPNIRYPPFDLKRVFDTQTFKPLNYFPGFCKIIHWFVDFIKIQCYHLQKETKNDKNRVSCLIVESGARGYI